MPTNGNSYGSVHANGGADNNNLETGEHSSESAKLLINGSGSHLDVETNGNGTTKKAIPRLSPFIKWFLIAVALSGSTGLTVLLYRRFFTTFQEPADNGLDPSYRHGPLSKLDPVRDLGMYGYDRPLASQPTVHRSPQAPNLGHALPTNAWYQSLLLLPNDPQAAPTNMHRAYSIPYMVDCAGPIAGLRVYPNHIGATSNIVQTYVIESQGVTTGLAGITSAKSGTKTVTAAPRYLVERMTPLGITMSWSDSSMVTTVVKGMPYATLEYNNIPIMSNDDEPMYPTVISETPILADYITVDQTTKWDCTAQETMWVDYEIEFYVPSSDFTWLIFVSEPVQFKCTINAVGQAWFQVVSRDPSSSSSNKPFVMRSALAMMCTKNRNPIYCHQEQYHPSALHLGQGEYMDILRQHAHLYAGSVTKFSFDFDDTEEMAVLEFDWNAQSTHYLHPATGNMTKSVELLSYALPHHWESERTMRSPSVHQIYCAASLVGPACLVEGSVWHIFEPIPSIDIRMPRPPAPFALQEISNSLNKDIHFRLPDFFQRGVGDTYFSGKMLAKLGRILIMAEELVEICSNTTNIKYDWGGDMTYAQACKNVALPSKNDRNAALASLRKSVQVWIDGTAKAPMVYDSTWGGTVNCGCLFDDGNCENEFPDCPAFTMPGLNFGNAFYNDMHFHYGYHIYAAAVVAHFDHDWGKRFFERVLLLVRNIANPSPEDKYFPVMRHKDPYQGHSWASGIVKPTFMNGRNQESSSESIAAYESVAIYGEVMSKIFTESGDKAKLAAADRVRRAGKYATTSELRSTKRYYHVDRSNPVRTYPAMYTEDVIGIMWQTMAQFQTWFGNARYLVYGIQLIPITPIGEHRDDLEWLKQIYPSMEESCADFDDCAATGWSVQILTSLAAAGHPKLAAEKALLLPEDAFTSAGGDGHSLTNTLWYIATRPKVDSPLVLQPEAEPTQAPTNHTVPYKEVHVVTNCYQPESCTDFVLDTVTALYTCRQRIQWLMWESGQDQDDACFQIATEFPEECGGCNPRANETSTQNATVVCPPCSERQCRSDLNRCPLYENTYVCTAGPNTGGCSGTPWTLNTGLCQDCCELTDCPRLSPQDLITRENGWGDNECATCSPQQCKESNVCPPSGEAPYLCLAGDSSGGCSTRPWNLHNGQCKECCTVGDDCPLANVRVHG